MKYKSSQYILIFNDKYLIDWTPKAGCTIICKMIFDHMGILEEALKYNRWIHHYRLNKFYRKYGKVTKSKLIDDKYIKIKFVRNPYTRAVSSYLHVMKTNTLPRGLKNRDISFYDFLILIKEKHIPYNVHWGLQKLEIENKKTIFNEIIQIEYLDNEIQRLNIKYNLDLKTKYNSTHHVKNKVNINTFCGKINFSELKVMPTYNNFYNDEIKLLVDNIYGEDIITYNYTFTEFLNREELN